MTNPVVSNYSVPTWVDDENNWRAADAHFLRSRSITRFSTKDNADNYFISASATTIGSICFVSGDTSSDLNSTSVGADPYFYANLSSSKKRILASTYLVPTDSSSTGVTLRHSATPALGGLTFSSTGAVSVGSSLTIGSYLSLGTASSITMTTATGGVVALKDSTGTGSSTISVTKSGVIFTLEVSTRLNAPSINATGAITSSSLTTATAIVNGPITVSGTTNVAAVVASGTITSPMIRTNAASDAIQLTGTALSNIPVSGTAATLDMAGNNVLINAPGSNGLKFRNASTETAVRVAGVVISPTQPTGSYPEGTIWLQVA